jgi:nucleoside-diphosphate kinase
MARERTFIFLKPDAVSRGLTGQILARIEQKGFKIVALKLMKVSKDLAERHYAIHKGKPFYDGLVKYVQSGPVVAAIVEGSDAIASMRRLLGATDPRKGAPGEIRFDYGQEIGRNLVHGSDAAETAKSEIAMWFGGSDIVEYGRTDDAWLFE